MKQFIVFLILFSVTIFSQDFRTPRPSPDATVTQYFGVTKVSIDYGSPGVKGRSVWGELVPFGEVWRTGANEVTSITFSTTVKIGATELSAGTYGLHTVPGEKEWEVIFSKDTKIDAGSRFDKEKEVLRIKVSPASTSFTERLLFTISDMEENSAMINMMWEKVKVPFKVEAATAELTVSSAKDAFKWNQLMAAATYCLENNYNLEEGFRWIQASSLINENYWNTRILAQYFEKMDKKKEAVSTLEKAIELGSKMSSPPFDFNSMKELLIKWKSN